MIAIKQRVIMPDKRKGILRQTVIMAGVKQALVDIDGKMFTTPYVTLALDEQATYGNGKTPAGKQRPRHG